MVRKSANDWVREKSGSIQCGNREMTQISFHLVKKNQKDSNKIIMIKHRNFCPVTRFTERYSIYSKFSPTQSFSQSRFHVFISQAVD